MIVIDINDNFDEWIIYALATRVYTQHFFVNFVAIILKEIVKVHGHNINHLYDEIDERNSQNYPQFITIFTRIAKFFINNNMKTKKKAYIYINLSFAKKLPHEIMKQIEVNFGIKYLLSFILNLNWSRILNDFII